MLDRVFFTENAARLRPTLEHCGGRSEIYPGLLIEQPSGALANQRSGVIVVQPPRMANIDEGAEERDAMGSSRTIGDPAHFGQNSSTSSVESGPNLADPWPNLGELG